MAAFSGEIWRSELPRHIIFTKLRDKLSAEPQACGRRYAKNLTFCLDGDFFVWDDVDSVFYTTNLRRLNTESADGARHQVRAPVCQTHSRGETRLHSASCTV